MSNAARIIIITNPKVRPASTPIGSNVRAYEVEISESATDAEVIAALKLQLESEQE